jgi:serine/threonine-protein kinase
MDRMVLALAPKYEWAHWELAMTLLQEGKPQQAVIELERLPEASPWRLGGLAVAYFAAGRKSDSDAALAELTMNHPQDAADHIAAAYAYRNEKDDAFKWIEIAYTQHELIWGLKVSQLWNHLRSDPRYQEWLRKLDLGDEP